MGWMTKREGELQEGATCKQYLQVGREGSRRGMAVGVQSESSMAAMNKERL